MSVKGYIVVGRKYLHRLIAKEFLADYSEDLQVNHINGIKTDNRVENLEMVTNAQNMQHALSLGLVNNKGSKNGMAKLLESDVLEIRRLYSLGHRGKELGPLFNVSPATIYDIVMKRRWRHL